MISYFNSAFGRRGELVHERLKLFELGQGGSIKPPHELVHSETEAHSAN